MLGMSTSLALSFPSLFYDIPLQTTSNRIYPPSQSTHLELRRNSIRLLSISVKQVDVQLV
jgi:hypothetical protein